MTSLQFGKYFLNLFSFTGFTREFVTFLIDNRKFAQEYGKWIQQNEESLIKSAAADSKHKISLFDVKMYANMFKQIIKERLSFVCTIYL